MAREYLMMGVALGLAAGLTPGPLLTYTIVATLRGGWRAGITVGSAPLLTDAPIIVLSLLILHFLPDQALRIVGIIGGLFVIYLGIETARTAHHVNDIRVEADVDLRREMGKGMLVNFLNPNPYLFWGTVGGPLLIQMARERVLDAAGFLIVFYALLVGSHVGLALIVHSRRGWLRGAWYRRTLWALAVVLVVLGARLIWQ